MSPEELEAVQRLVDLAHEQVDPAHLQAERCKCWSCRWGRETARARAVIANLLP